MSTLVFIISPKTEITTAPSMKAARELTMSDRNWLIVSKPEELPAAGTARLGEIFKAVDPDRYEVADHYERHDVYDAMVAKFTPSAASPSGAAGQPHDGTETTMTQATADTAKEAAPAKAKAKTTPAKGKTAAKPAAAKKAAAPKRQLGKPAGPVADFGQVLKGSKRANILSLMDGKLNAEGIGKKLGIPTSLVSSNIFCLHRDIGVGYSYGEGGVITAVYPKGKTLADALKEPGAGKKPAAKKGATAAAKKPAAAKKTSAKKGAPKDAAGEGAPA